MPSSQVRHVSDVLQAVLVLRPASILDVGVGFGRWGILCRELLDILFERYEPEDWITTIDGVEAFESYLKPYHSYFYNSITIDTIQSVIQSWADRQYDLIIAGDMIEHLEFDEGVYVVQELRRRASRGLIVSVPLGDWPQGAVFDNPFEVHRASWTAKDIERLDPDSVKYYSIRGDSDHAVFGWGVRLGKEPSLSGWQRVTNSAWRLRNLIRR